MRILKFAVVAALLVLPVTFASASVQSSSSLVISDFLVTKAGGGAITVSPTPGADITVLGVTDTSTLIATVNGVTDFNPGGAIDGTAAFSNGVTTGNVGIENLFSAGLPPVGGNPFAYADSAGSGNILLGGASVTSFSAVGADNVPFVSDSGSATSTLISRSVLLENTSGSDLSIEFSFDALLDIVLDNDVPHGILSGAASFFVEISGLIPGADPITVGGTASDQFTFEPAALNGPTLSSFGADITVSPGLTTYTSPVITIDDGAQVSFEIFQATSASVNIVPEPTAFLVWGLLGIASGTVAIRRLRML